MNEGKANTEDEILPMKQKEIYHDR
jgi:hypothetical protein